MSSKLNDELKHLIFEDLERQRFDIQPPAYFGSEKIHESYVFAEPTEKNSVLVDVSQIKELASNGKAVAEQLREYYPDAIGIKFGTTSGYHLNNKVYVEVIFETESESEEALRKQYFSLLYTNEEGYKFRSTFYVSKPLPKNSKVIHIDISGIPLQKATNVRDLLMNMFSKHGEVLKMGINVSAYGKWFSGDGYITLITHKSKDKYEELLKSQMLYGGITYSIKSCLLN